MSIVEIQEELEYWPDQKIQEEIMRPTGAANGQTYLVVLESERRTKERQAYENQMAQQEQPQMTVAEESAMELGGGIMDVDPNLMQNQMMAQQMQQQMPQQMPQGQPMAMRGGGAIRYQDAGSINNGYRVEGGMIVPFDEVTEEEGLEDFSFMDAPEYLAEGLGLPAILGTLASGPRGWMKNVIEGLGKRSIAKGKVLPTRSAKTTRDVPLKKTSGGNYKPIDPDQPIKFRPDGTAYQTIDSVGSPRMKSYYDAGTERITDVAKHGAVLGGTGGATYLAASNLMDGSGDVQAEDVVEDKGMLDSPMSSVDYDEITLRDYDSLSPKLQKIVDAERVARQVKRDAAEAINKDITAEKDRRAGLTEAGRLFEDAKKNIPEDETYKDYLSTLEGMEESRKGQVLMDLGSAIANAGHGGDIAKGIQEAGTKARTEKLAVAKEIADTLSAKRAADIDLQIKLTTLDTTLKQQSGKTINELLSILDLNDTWIEDTFPDRAEEIKKNLGKALELALSSLPDTDR